jgi:predicted TIM-barrel fold metal-dependent hydrolase
MILDIHVHIAVTEGAQRGNYISPDCETRSDFRAFLRGYGLRQRSTRWHKFDATVKRKTLCWLEESRVDRAVLLAQDFAHTPDGQKDSVRTQIAVGNDYVAALAASHPKLLFGASVHPSRPDALEELERVIQMGAALVQWNPLAQNIVPDDAICMPFYEVLAHHGVPLLCHTGGESFPKAFPIAMGDPRRLIPALQRGVTVIAAHCGARLKFLEPSFFEDWRRMALDYEHFYGDLSHFCCPTRMWPLGTILETPDLAAKLVFGSDFPSWNIPWTLVGQLGYTRVAELRDLENPFERALETLQDFGVTPEILGRAAKLLRVSPHKADNAMASAA